MAMLHGKSAKNGTAFRADKQRCLCPSSLVRDVPVVISDGIKISSVATRAIRLFLIVHIISFMTIIGRLEKKYKQDRGSDGKLFAAAVGEE